MFECFKSALFFFLLVVLAVEARAQIKADPVALDFGRQQQEKTVTAEVKLTNIGESPLGILSVNADCSCTVAAPERTALAPGESTMLKISVETRAYQGLVHRNIRVQSSAGEVVIPIALTVSLYKSWTLTPSVIVLPPSQKGHEVTLPVSLQYTGGGQASVGKITCTPSWLNATTTSQDGINFKIALTKNAGAPAGNHSVKVVVETSDPAEPQLTFNVFVPISSILRVTPNPAILPTVKVGQPAVRELVIYGWSKSDAPRLKLAHGSVRLQGRDGEQVRAEVSVTPEWPGPMTQLLQIYDGETLEAEIPVILRAESIDKTK